MDAERLDLEAIKETLLRSQSWDDPDAQSYMAAPAETDIDALIEALEAERRENERLRGDCRAEDALRRELAWQSEVIDMMFPVVVSAHSLMETPSHTADGAICPLCLRELAEAVCRWDAWLNAAGAGACAGNKSEAREAPDSSSDWSPPVVQIVWGSRPY